MRARFCLPLWGSPPQAVVDEVVFLEALKSGESAPLPAAQRPYLKATRGDEV